MNLTDDEMRVKVATLMGWAVPVTRDKYPTHGQLKTGDDSYQELPRFTTSVDAALTLCDRLREEGGECFIDNSVGAWRCHFMNVALDINVWLEDPSLARAICVAFLKIQDSIAHSP